MVLLGPLDPGDVVAHLLGNLGGRMFADLSQHVHSDVVGDIEVLRLAGSADPAERAEAVVEAHRSHNVLNVRGIAETAVLLEDVGTGAGGLQQEGVAVVEEVHALGRQLVDGDHLAA